MCGPRYWQFIGERNILQNFKKLIWRKKLFFSVSPKLFTLYLQNSVLEIQGEHSLRKEEYFIITKYILSELAFHLFVIDCRTVLNTPTVFILIHLHITFIRFRRILQRRRGSAYTNDLLVIR